MYSVIYKTYHSQAGGWIRHQSVVDNNFLQNVWQSHNITREIHWNVQEMNKSMCGSLYAVSAGSCKSYAPTWFRDMTHCIFRDLIWFSIILTNSTLVGINIKATMNFSGKLGTTVCLSLLCWNLVTQFHINDNFVKLNHSYFAWLPNNTTRSILCTAQCFSV